MAKIFVTDKKHKADICVCEVKEYKADMKYWIADREHKSKNNDSKWFYVGRDHKADKIIFWSKEYQANIKVREVSKEYKAKGNF